VAREVAGKLSDMKAKDTVLQIVETETWREKVRRDELMKHVTAKKALKRAATK
jgi:hypothetical protein